MPATGPSQVCVCPLFSFWFFRVYSSICLLVSWTECPSPCDAAVYQRPSRRQLQGRAKRVSAGDAVRRIVALVYTYHTTYISFDIRSKLCGEANCTITIDSRSKMLITTLVFSDIPRNEESLRIHSSGYLKEYSRGIKYTCCYLECWHLSRSCAVIDCTSNSHRFVIGHLKMQPVVKVSNLIN